MYKAAQIKYKFDRRLFAEYIGLNKQNMKQSRLKQKHYQALFLRG